MLCLMMTMELKFGLPLSNWVMGRSFIGASSKQYPIGDFGSVSFSDRGRHGAKRVSFDDIVGYLLINVLAALNSVSCLLFRAV